MALDVKNQGNQRGAGNSKADGSAQYAQLDASGNWLVAQGGAQYTEMARAGGIWMCIGAAAAPIATIPGTTAVMTIQNNSGTVGPAFVMEIIDLFMFNLLSTAIIHNPSIWASVQQLANPTTSGLAIASQTGRTGYTAAATTRINTGAAITVAAAGWRPFGGPVTPALETATVGTAWAAPVQGQLLVPPGSALCLQVVDTTASGTAQPGAAWNERFLTPGVTVA